MTSATNECQAMSSRGAAPARPLSSSTAARARNRGTLSSRALGVIARAKGMAQIAQAAGLGRESLYKALSPEGNPEFATVLKVMRALGLKLKVAV